MARLSIWLLSNGWARPQYTASASSRSETEAMARPAIRLGRAIQCRRAFLTPSLNKASFSHVPDAGAGLIRFYARVL